MINLICGPKGTGKTKIILEKIDEAIKVAKEYLVPKCERLGYCDEDKSCGRMPVREK